MIPLAWLGQRSTAQGADRTVAAKSATLQESARFSPSSPAGFSKRTDARGQPRRTRSRAPGQDYATLRPIQGARGAGSRRDRRHPRGDRQRSRGELFPKRTSTRVPRPATEARRRRASDLGRERHGGVRHPAGKLEPVLSAPCGENDARRSAVSAVLWERPSSAVIVPVGPIAGGLRPLLGDATPSGEASCRTDSRATCGSRECHLRRLRRELVGALPSAARVLRRRRLILLAEESLGAEQALVGTQRKLPSRSRRRQGELNGG